MSPHRSGAAVRVLHALGTACFLTACGTPGPPVPPRVEKPERVTDLAVAQIGQRLEISFTAPEQATDGERLSKPLEIQILRAVTPPGEAPPDTAAFGVWLNLRRRDLPQDAQADKIEYADRLSDREFGESVGSTFSFAVRALTRGFRGRAVPSDLSNVVQATLLDVSGPVQDVKPHTTERAVQLSWSPPSRSLTGHPVSELWGYRVYRSETTNVGQGLYQLLGEAQAAAYVDPNFQFGRRYSYKVRAIFKRGDQIAQTEDSAVAEITPLDTFPPAVPKGLSGLYTEGTIELIWTANTESDLAGYNVYRRESSGASERLNRDLLLTPIYRDSSVEAGHRYFYRVSAVDLANNESEPSIEIPVESQ